VSFLLHKEPIINHEQLTHTQLLNPKQIRMKSRERLPRLFIVTWDLRRSIKAQKRKERRKINQFFYGNSIAFAQVCWQLRDVSLASRLAKFVAANLSLGEG